VIAGTAIVVSVLVIAAFVFLVARFWPRPSLFRIPVGKTTGESIRLEKVRMH
jgi:hypothetical protein